MPAKNSLGDVHNLLMEQLERLNEATPEQLDGEIQRSKAVSDISQAITNNARTMLNVMQLQCEYNVNVPHALSPGSNN